MDTHSVTLGCYPRDFDAPCETGLLRARERLNPWLEICHRVVAQFSQYSRMSPSDLGFFVCAKRSAVADGAGGSSAVAGSPVAPDKAVARAACVHYACCTGRHRAANRGARGRRRVVMWLTCYTALMCVGADQEHSCPMGAHCLDC